MKTTKKEVKTALRKHILDNIEAEDRTLETTKEKLEYVVECFNAEYVYPGCMKRYGTYQDLFISYLMGLPGCLTVEFEYHKIIEFLNSIGLEQPADKDALDSSELYYKLIYREFSAMLRKHNIPLITAKTTH